MVPAHVEVFEDYGAYRFFEVWPEEQPKPGTVFSFGIPPDLPAVTYHYVLPPDHEPPVLDSVRWQNGLRVQDSSCGRIEFIAPILDGHDLPDSDAPVFSRMRSARNGLTWHHPYLHYDDTCGGYPGNIWRERMDIVLVDLAGNESEPIRRAVPSRIGCACASAPGAPLPLGMGFVLVGLLAAGRRTRQPHAGSGPWLWLGALCLLVLAGCQKPDYCDRVAEIRRLQEHIGECELERPDVDMELCRERLTSSCSKRDQGLLEDRMDCYDLLPPEERIVDCVDAPIINECWNEVEFPSATCHYAIVGI